MGWAQGVNTRRKGQARCRKCGEPICFQLRPGFIEPGKPRYFTVNADDHLPHWKRCRINQDLKAAKQQARLTRPKRAARPAPGRGEAPTLTQQGEMFDGSKT